ncbi:unnamed protein product, partial [Soboliphyme baturini]|uniref:DHC_N1 domain-containing protein n=1 Tax=Soboliphyme baturini TaxID=241478 RepID=A0A183J805_9BILA
MIEFQNFVTEFCALRERVSNLYDSTNWQTTEVFDIVIEKSGQDILDRGDRLIVACREYAKALLATPYTPYLHAQCRSLLRNHEHEWQIFRTEFYSTLNQLRTCRPIVDSARKRYEKLIRDAADCRARKDLLLSSHSQTHSFVQPVCEKMRRSFEKKVRLAAAFIQYMDVKERVADQLTSLPADSSSKIFETWQAEVNRIPISCLQRNFNRQIEEVLCMAMTRLPDATRPQSVEAECNRLRDHTPSAPSMRRLVIDDVEDICREFCISDFPVCDCRCPCDDGAIPTVDSLASANADMLHILDAVLELFDYILLCVERATKIALHVSNALPIVVQEFAELDEQHLKKAVIDFDRAVAPSGFLSVLITSLRDSPDDVQRQWKPVLYGLERAVNENRRICDERLD